MNHCPRRPTNLSLLIVFSLLLVIGCAEIGRPPGGEVDRQAPELVSSYPENGALQVSSGSEIEILFTERVVEPSRGQPVFISPRQAKAPRVKWSAERIRITLDEPFDSNQTYIVSVSSEVQDLRGNRLDSAISIAFSTGGAIDSGRVAGQVLREGKPAAGMLMALYDPQSVDDTLPYDSIYPAYLTSSSKSGEFAFQYLPVGEYRLVGFEDKNRDERLNPGRESFALPDRDIVVGGELPVDSLVLSMTQYDSLSPAVLTALGTKNNLVRIRLNKSIPLDLLGPHPSNLLLRPTKDSLTVYPAQGLLEADEEEAAVLTAFVGQLPEGEYTIELTYAVDQPPLSDSLSFVLQADDEAPSITEFEPDEKPEFLQQIQMQMRFSEPLDTSRINDQSFVLWQGESTPIDLELNWRDAFRLDLTPAELEPGHKYRLDVTEFELVDLAGNVLGDSLRSYSFATLDDDSLGSVSGETVISVPGRIDSPVVLTFSSVSDKRTFEVTASNRIFDLTLPPGKYLLSGYIDQDANDERYDGSLFPFKLAETQAFHPDTIAVRARFETAGVVFEFK
ncbi:MAG: Ig-like domain-containing protein [bacterium]|nr:Ig-like domain-containing protein [bacterium]